MISLFIIIVIIVSGLVLYPLVTQKGRPTLIDEMSHPIDDLDRQKDQLLQSIRELDFDYETGKVSAKDYQSIRENIEKQTVEVMKELERAQKNWDEMEKSL